jgi:hypothetical protein
MTYQDHIHVGARYQHFRPVKDVSARNVPQIRPDLHVRESAGNVELSCTELHGLLRNVHYGRDFVQMRKQAEGRQLEAGVSSTRSRLHTSHGVPHMGAHCDFPGTDELRVMSELASRPCLRR